MNYILGFSNDTMDSVILFKLNHMNQLKNVTFYLTLGQNLALDS